MYIIFLLILCGVIFAVPLLLLIGLFYLVFVLPFGKTTYSQQTGKGFFAAVSNKGSHGEYLIYQSLKKFEASGAKFLFNCYVPKENGETTEIDVMMIHSTGIYVLESKNYSGWIFGSEDSRTWTQTLPQGRRGVRKEHFLNPLMQNKLHVKSLNKYLNIDIPIYPIVVFSQRCTLKRLELHSKEAVVVQQQNLCFFVAKMIESNQPVLSQQEVENLFSKLYPLTQVTDEERWEHVENIKHRSPIAQTTQNISQDIVTPMLCPRCGSSLVLRTAKEGRNAGKQFYGCISYPYCRYIRSL